MQSVSPKAKTLWLVPNLVCLVALTVGLVTVLGNVPAGIGWLLPAVVYLGLATALVIWPDLRYRHYRFCHDDVRLVVESGVVFRHRTVAPLCQIQDLHLFQDPLMRLLGLGKIMVSTGGSNFDIKGLELNQAKALLEELETKLRRRIEEQGHEEI